MIMKEVAPLVNAQVGAFFLADQPEAPDVRARLRALVCAAGTASTVRGRGTRRAAVVPARRGPRRPGRRGRAAGAGRRRAGGLPADPLRGGRRRAAAVVVLPVLFEGRTLGVIEFGAVTRFSELHLTFLERLVVTIGVAISTIQANRRTEELLAQSQGLAVELQDQSAELQRTNAELEEKAAQLSEQNRNIEIKNREIDAARRGVEEKAQQLAPASQYKSEFLANMSHELRTPLNSLLLLSRLLADNPDANLTRPADRVRPHHPQRRLRTCCGSSTTSSTCPRSRRGGWTSSPPVDLAEIRGYVERAFGPQAEHKGLELRVEAAPGLPAEIVTDGPAAAADPAQPAVQRGEVHRARHRHADDRARPRGCRLRPADGRRPPMVAFTVRDTGIGIADDKLAMIFEAFQQADGTTSRKYGGTGLGLSISRELARLLGGAITVSSRPGAGSEFTLYLPDDGRRRRAPPSRPPAPGHRAAAIARAPTPPASVRRWWPGPAPAQGASRPARWPARPCSSSTTTCATCSP